MQAGSGKGFVIEFCKWWNENKMPHSITKLDIDEFIKSKEVSNKPDYEILYYKNSRNGNIVEASLVDLDYVRKNTDADVYKIHSVKKLSDSEIFTVGDKVKSTWGEQIITGFEIASEIEMVVEFQTCRNPLCGIEKAKERIPLFISEDGKEIFEGDRCWFVDKDFKIDFYDFNYYSGTRSKEDLEHFPDIFKYFSTEEAAKNYVLNNKPCLSIQDITNNAKYVTAFRIEIDYKGLKELAQQKINYK